VRPEVAVGDSSLIATINAADFRAEVLAADRPVLVEFGAPWCTPCRISLPILAELAEEFDQRLQFVALNTDENPELTEAYRITSIPTFALFSNGELCNLWVGARSKAALRTEITTALANIEKLLAK